MNTLKSLLRDVRSESLAFHEQYAAIFEKVRPETVLVVGNGTHASLEAWVRYLPGASFVYVDTFPRDEPDNIPMMAHCRVNWIACDPSKAHPENGDIRFDMAIITSIDPEYDRAVYDRFSTVVDGPVIFDNIALKEFFAASFPDYVHYDLRHITDKSHSSLMVVPSINKTETLLGVMPNGKKEEEPVR